MIPWSTIHIQLFWYVYVLKTVIRSFSAQILTGHYYQIEAALDLKFFY